jgi:hypothetical protein
MKTNMIHLCLLAVTAVVFSGCTSTYESTSPVPFKGKLKADGSAYVALPEDGHFETIPYPGSGRKTALAISEAFSRHLKKVEVAPEVSSYDQSLEKAKNGSFDYLVVPTILHWEDRATEWSGRPDRIQIELRTVDVPTAATLGVESIKGTSKWATLGGDVPEDLLKVPIDAYVDSLFTNAPAETRP